MYSKLPTPDDMPLVLAKEKAKAEAAIRQMLAKCLIATSADLRDDHGFVISLPPFRDLLLKFATGYKSVTATAAASPNDSFYFRLARELGAELVEAGWNVVIFNPTRNLNMRVYRRLPYILPFRGPCLVAVRDEAAFLRARSEGRVPIDAVQLSLQIPAGSARGAIFSDLPQHLMGQMEDPPLRTTGAPLPNAAAIRNTLRRGQEVLDRPWSLDNATSFAMPHGTGNAPQAATTAESGEAEFRREAERMWQQAVPPSITEVAELDRLIDDIHRRASQNATVRRGQPVADEIVMGDTFDPLMTLNEEDAPTDAP